MDAAALCCRDSDAGDVAPERAPERLVPIVPEATPRDGRRFGKGGSSVAQVQQESLPIASQPSCHEGEQRSTQRALRYWEALRGNRLTPRFSDFRYDDRLTWNANLFLLKEDSLVGNSVFILCGEQAAQWFGGQPLRKTLFEVLPGQIRDQATRDCERAIETKGPAGSEGWYRPRGRPKVLYRYIFLPLEASHTDSGYIIGAYSCKQTAVRRSAPRRSAAQATGACGAM